MQCKHDKIVILMLSAKHRTITMAGRCASGVGLRSTLNRPATDTDQVGLFNFGRLGQPFLISNILLPMGSEQKPKFQHAVQNSGTEYDAFRSALRQILRVSHDDMLRRLERDKKARASKPRPSASRVSSDKD